MLKHLPERYLPDPERYLPESESLKKVEGSLMLALGIIGLSLLAALFSGWFPTEEMASALSGDFPMVLLFLAMACVSLWWAYVLWRSKCYDEGWEEEGKQWLWGWGVTTQLLAGLGFLSVAARTLLTSLLG